MTLLAIAGVAWLSRALASPSSSRPSCPRWPRPSSSRWRPPSRSPRGRSRPDARSCRRRLRPWARRPRPRARGLRPVGAALPEGAVITKLRRALPRPRARGPRSAGPARSSSPDRGGTGATCSASPWWAASRSCSPRAASWVCHSCSRRSSGPWPRPSTRGRRVCRASRRSGSSRSWRCRAAASSTCEPPTRRPARGSCARRSSPTSTGASGGTRRARPEPSGPGRRAFCNPAWRRLVWARSSSIPARGFPRSQPLRRRTQTSGGPRSRSSSTSRKWGTGPSCCRTASPP